MKSSNPRYGSQYGEKVTHRVILASWVRAALPEATKAGTPQRQVPSRPSRLIRGTQDSPAPADQLLLGVLRSLSHTQTVFSPYAKAGVALSLPDTWDNIYRRLDAAIPLVPQLRLPQLAALADVLSAAGYTNGAFYDAVFAAATQQLARLQQVYVQPQPAATHPLRLTWQDRRRLRQRAKQQRLRRPPSKDMLAPIRQQIAGAGRPLPLLRKPVLRPAHTGTSSSQAQLTPALLWLCLTRLTVACARLGTAPLPLLQLVSRTGAQLLRVAPPSFQQQRSLVTLARILAAFAALGCCPAPLAAAIGQVIKLQPRAMQRLPPWEVLLLLWATARMRHSDQALLLQLQHRAAQQVGLFNCQQLSRAYALLGAVEEEEAVAGQQAVIDWGAPEGAALLAALRKSTRLRLNSFAAPQLVQLVLGLAGLQQQDSLLMDELSRWLHNKAGNFTAAEVVTIITSCARLGYLNPWLLERLSKALMSPKRQLVPQLHVSQLLQLLEACSQLGYANIPMLEHVGQALLAPGTTAAAAALSAATAAPPQHSQPRVPLPALVLWPGRQVVLLLQVLLQLRAPVGQLLAACGHRAEDQLQAYIDAAPASSRRPADTDPPPAAVAPHQPQLQQPSQHPAGLQQTSSSAAASGLASQAIAEGWSLGDALQCVVTLHHLGAAPASLVATAGVAAIQGAQHAGGGLAPSLLVQLTTAAVACVLQQQGGHRQPLEGQALAGVQQGAASLDILGGMLRLVQQQQHNNQQQQQQQDGTAETFVQQLPAAVEAGHTLSVDMLALLQAVYALLQAAPSAFAQLATEDSLGASSSGGGSSSSRGVGRRRSRQQTGESQLPATPSWTLGVGLAAVEDALAAMASAAVRAHGEELSDLAAAVQALPGAEGCGVQVCWVPSGSPLLLPVALTPNSSTGSSDLGRQPQGVAFFLVARDAFTQSQPQQLLGALHMQQLVLECCGWGVVWIPLEAWQQTQQVPAAGRPRKRWQLLVECLREAGRWDTHTGRLHLAV